MVPPQGEKVSLGLGPHMTTGTKDNKRKISVCGNNLYFGHICPGSVFREAHWG